MAGYFVRNNIIYVQGSVNGKYYRLSTKKEATKKNLRWIERNHRDVLLKLVDKDKPKITHSFIEYARQSLKNNAPSRKESTNKDYQLIFDKHILPYFKHFNLEDFKPSFIKEWQAKLLEKGLSPKSVKNIRIVLSTILNDAVMDEIIEKNPVLLVKPPKQEKSEVEVFSLDEVKILLKNADGWFKHFLTVAFFTGMRTGELLALKWEDVNFHNKTIHVRRSRRQGVESDTKTGKSRIIDMLPIVEKSLKEQFKENGLNYKYVFTTKAGYPFFESNSIANRYWKPLLKRCLISYRKLYSTRHTFASIMLQKGEDIAWISNMLGHADISTTLRYYAKYIDKQQIKRAKFLDDFLENDCTPIAHFEKIV